MTGVDAAEGDFGGAIAFGAVGFECPLLDAFGDAFEGFIGTLLEYFGPGMPFAQDLRQSFWQVLGQDGLQLFLGRVMALLF